MIYAILKNHQKFEKLAEFSLDNALIEIERIRQAKENRVAQQQRQPSEESSGSMSEKAKGKLPEGSLSRASSSSSVHSLPQRQSSVSSVSSIGSLLPGAKNGFIPTDDWVNRNKVFKHNSHENLNACICRSTNGTQGYLWKPYLL